MPRECARRRGRSHRIGFNGSTAPVDVRDCQYLPDRRYTVESTVPAAESMCLIGPAGTGKSHMLLALGEAAVVAGYRVKYFTAADLVDTLCRGLADHSVGRVITNLLRNDVVLVDELSPSPRATIKN